MRRKPTIAQIERAAHAIIKVASPHGTGLDGSAWNEKFISTAKWPRDFYPMERKYARRIARAALNAAMAY